MERLRPDNISVVVQGSDRLDGSPWGTQMTQKMTQNTEEAKKESD